MEVANVEMARHWDGEEGDEWTENADRYDATDKFIWQRFSAVISVGGEDHVLDIGCGTGKSTRELARAAGAGHVVGIDLSSQMLEFARRRTEEEGLSNVEYVQGDAQVYGFPSSSFDLGVSAFGAMFFCDPVSAFANIRSALRPNGRLALLAWQRFDRNEWLLTLFDALSVGRQLPTPEPGLPGPFGLADREVVRRVLDEAGFREVAVTPADAPVWLGRNAQDAWDFVSAMGIVRGLTSDLGDDVRRIALDRVRDVIGRHETPDGVLLGAAEWIITARS